VLVIAVTVVASVVTPAVVITALMLQKTAIATAAIVLANAPPGEKRPFTISLALQFEWNKQAIHSEPALSLKSYQSFLLK
jgi:hypothetical protein